MEDVEMNHVAKSTQPSKAIGFAAAANFVASDSDQETFVFRKFNRLSARNLISMQNELMYLEQQQDVLDREVALSTDHVLASAMMDYDDFKENLDSHPGLQKRRELQDQIAKLLDKYHNALLLQHGVAQLEKPTSLALKTYREVIFGAGKLPAKVGSSAKRLVEEDNEQDLVALNRPIDKDILSKFLRAYWPFSGQYIENHDNARSFEHHSLLFVVRLCSTAVAAILVIGPILALYFTKNQDVNLALVIAFVILFAIGLSICTGATRDSIFAGTAAYAAVLIVFVSGNLSNGGRHNPIT